MMGNRKTLLTLFCETTLAEAHTTTLEPVGKQALFVFLVRAKDLA